MKFKTTYIPTTPGGTTLFHLEASTESQAWKNLLDDATRIPYKTIEQFRERGYTMYILRVTVDEI